MAPKHGSMLPRGLMAAAFILLAQGLFATGSAENKSSKYPEYTAKITGVIRLVGNEPFTRLVVTTDEGKTYIINDKAPERKSLHNWQGRRVRMEGTVREYPVSAGTIDLGIEYHITPTICDLLDASGLDPAGRQLPQKN